MYAEQDLFGSISLVDMSIEELTTIRTGLQDKQDAHSTHIVACIDNFLKTVQK